MKQQSMQPESASWSQHNGKWLVCCAGGAPGKRVRVTRRDGSEPVMVTLREAVGRNDWGGIYRYEKCGDRPEKPKEAGPADGQNVWERAGGMWFVRIRDGGSYSKGDMIDVVRSDGTPQRLMVLCVQDGLAEAVHLKDNGTYRCRECNGYVRPGGACSETGWEH